MINLTKGSTIDLSKASTKGLSSVCFGLDWGAIKTGGFFGFGSSVESVDLDATAIVYDTNKSVVDTVYFGKRQSDDRCIYHTGDDRGGDAEDDNSDNEVIIVDLEKINSRAKYISFVLNSFSGQKFNDIPYVRLRVYSGKKNQPTEMLGKLELSNDAEFNGSRAMVMGVVENTSNGWIFKAIGKSTNDSDISGLKRSSVQSL